MTHTTGAIPLINTNGTSANVLIEQRIEVQQAIRKTMQALEEIRPHGRDYQHDRTGQHYKAAMEIYSARFAALDKLHNEIGDEIWAIEAQRQK